MDSRKAVKIQEMCQSFPLLIIMSRLLLAQQMSLLSLSENQQCF